MGGAAGAEGAGAAGAAGDAAGSGAAMSGMGQNIMDMSKFMKDNNIQAGGSAAPQQPQQQRQPGMGSPGIGEAGNFDLMKAIQAQLAKGNGGGGYGGAGAM